MGKQIVIALEEWKDLASHIQDAKAELIGDGSTLPENRWEARVLRTLDHLRSGLKILEDN